ncbi:MAG: cache domain-containing protein [Candidatus Tumulicola sp.]
MKRFTLFFFAATLVSLSAVRAAPATFTIDGNVGLSSLVALGDGHLQAMADTLQTLAATDDARSGQWTRIAPPLRRAAATNVDAVLLFAQRDGSYWTLQGGRQKTSLADRPYFSKLLAGETVIGDLVTSRSTGKPVAMVAVPIRGANGAVAGALGAGIYLDALSARIKREMGIGPNTIFWAIDSRGVIALHSDPNEIFVEPHKLSPDLMRVMTTMLAHDEGAVTYQFRGRTRSVLYRKSPLTGWRYGFGVLQAE